MPLNRNPKWFGLTQAQERSAGIDTVLGIGGRLVIFQFKAKQKGKLKIERDQCRKLTNIELRYPNSTFYVFPEAEDIFVAGRETCLFRHAWCCLPSQLLSAFASSKQTTSFSLDRAGSKLTRQRPLVQRSVSTACTRFGCFCPPSQQQSSAAYGRLVVNLVSLLLAGKDEAKSDVVLPPFAENVFGIPIFGDPKEAYAGAEPITSAEQFEQLFNDNAYHDLHRGVYGLFIAN